MHVYHKSYSSSSSSSTSESVSSAWGSSSVAWLLQVCSLHMSVHLRPLLRQVHTGSLHECTHLQERSCSTSSGAGSHASTQLSTTRFPSSSVVQPQSVGLGTNGEGSKTSPPDGSLVVCMEFVHGQAVLTRRKLTWVHFCTPCTEDLVTELVDLCCAGGRKVHLAVSQSSSERPSSVKASR